MDIIKVIEQTNNFTYEVSFDCAVQCGKLLTGNDADRAIVRRAAIHILDKWDNIPSATYPIWGDIIEAVGFYPYIAKNESTIKMDTLADEVRQKSFMSEYLPDTYMHSKQKELSDYLRSDKNVVASAPTSFGKSLLIEELVASQKYGNIVIIQPTLALLDETRLKLKKYKELYKIIVRTSQKFTTDSGNLFLLTAERVMEYANLPKIDLLIIDEFYKMSLKRPEDKDRTNTLNNAFLKIYDTFNPKFYLLGPNISDITVGFINKYNAEFFKTDYSLVDCDVTIKTDFNTKNDRKTALYRLLDEISEKASQQTLVYCSTPARTRGMARGYLKHLKNKSSQPTTNLPVIEWLESAIPNWSLIEQLKYGIAVHDASLPKHLGTSIIRYFNENRLRCIFCTSTIIEGVNTSAKNVIIYDGKKGLRDIDYFDYNNIRGRSGRLMEHYIGNVFCFVQPPALEEVIIDIPFFEQDPEVLTSEILVNIKDSDVQQQVRSKYDGLNAIAPELLHIFKTNGTSIEGQKAIYHKLESEINFQQNNIVWSQIPTKEQIQYILGICEGNYFSLEPNRGVVSVAQLAVLLDIYRKTGTFSTLITNQYEHTIKKLKNQTDQKKAEHYDKAIEIVFHIYRRWFQFTVPKAFRVVDSLQRFVCEKRSIKAGSYTYFVQQLENDFIRENLSILVEYGIPSETVRKLMTDIPAKLSEDDVLQYIQANKNTLFAPLMQYERDRLEHCL